MCKVRLHLKGNPILTSMEQLPAAGNVIVLQGVPGERLTDSRCTPLPSESDLHV